MNFEELLNEEQLKAVTSTSQYIKVIAGAGSGKTRVLTYRIAYLISNLNVYSSNILGITFTNKAAKEIKERVQNILPSVSYMALSTIHSWCARFLRENYEYISYPRNFTILDEEDQLQVMKDIFVLNGYNKKDKIIKDCLAWIGGKKTEGLQYKDLKGTHYPNTQYNLFLRFYEEYTSALQKTASLDFDDLLLKTIEILENYEDVRARYQKKFSHILVDEFQDINDVQFYLIRLLMGEETSLYVVGDPDQTIYTWRGANNKIMLDLEKNIRVDYPNAKVDTLILKNNYRSSKNILDSANALISHNEERIKKDLFPINPEGDKISFYNARTAVEEASFIASTINDLVKDNNYKYSTFAVLYRSNYLTRELETQLNLHQVPYKLFGGQKFYQRREIKDVLSYMYLLINPLDDQSLERIINVPKRNIGPTTVDTIKKQANEFGQTMYIFLKENLNYLIIPSSKKTAIENFINLLEDTKNKINSAENKDYGDIIQKMLDKIKYFDYLKEEENGEERIENVQELIGTIKIYFLQNREAEFADFIINATLQASSDEVEGGEYVSLMTVHTAKGLEFDNVFIYGFNEGVFPSNRALEESKKGIEEERRLAYVAITRARKKLYISCNQDFSYVAGSFLKPSRFLKEAGIKVQEEKKMTSYINSYNNNLYKKKDEVKKIIPTSNGVSSWSVGDLLTHEQFGSGKVSKVISDKLIEVKFDNPEYGTKTLLGSHYKIKKIVS